MDKTEHFNNLSRWAAESEQDGKVKQAQEWRDKRWMSFPSGPQKQMYFPGTLSGKWEK